MPEHDARHWIRQRLATSLGLPVADIVLDKSIYDYGMDSVDAVILAGELEEYLGIEVDPAAFLQQPTLEAMIAGLAPSSSASEIPRSPPAGRKT
jgi:acyl carrier protein